jgi:hypothetical protein
MNNEDIRRQELESRLELLTTEFERQMRARGFDPAQAENVALPSSLARLYGECQTIKEELEESKGVNHE